MVKEKAKQGLIFMIFGCVLYFSLMSHQLVNHYDGLWNYSYYEAGKWELSLGRWLWLYLDRLRFATSPDPITSLLTLGCFTLGVMLVLDLFRVENKIMGYLAGGLFLSNAVVCNSLSYRYMSPTFGMAFLLNILGAWVLIKYEKHTLTAILSGGLLIALGTGCYQADMGCACVLFLLYPVFSVLKEQKTIRQLLPPVGKMAASLLTGGAFYMILTKLHLWFFKVEMSAYNGGAGYSVSNTLRKLPASFCNAYREFGSYFSNQYFKTNLIHVPLLYLLPSVLILAALLLQMRKKGGILLLFLLVPAACGAVLFVATDTALSMQMTAPWALLLPCLLCLLSHVEFKPSKYTGYAAICALCVVLYGSIYQVTADQDAMLEGQTATTTLTSRMMDALQEKDLLEATRYYCIIGEPIHNPLFAKSEIFNMANTYAQFGNWWPQPGCTRLSWGAVFSHLQGININICSEEDYVRILATEEAANLPVFPAEGCITEIDNIVVIKVSP